MNTQKISSIKILAFDKTNYKLWKKKMMLFIKMVNPLYVQILKNSPFTPMERVDESIDGDMVIPAHYTPKDPSKYTEPEKEKVPLDNGLQLILIESFDNVMCNNIINSDTAKQIWEKIKILCEVIEEVRSNQRRILVSQYEGFMAKPKESITDVFERFNKLINDLKEDFSNKRRERLGHDDTEVLYANHLMMEVHTLVISISEQKNKEPHKQVILELEEYEFYTLDELDELDHSMAYLARKFSKIKVKKPKFFRNKGQTSNQDNSWKGKTQFNSGKCRKPKKVKKNKAYLELEEFEAVKQENEYLKNKLKCANEIEAVSREKIEKNEVKLKSFRNAFQLVGQYHEKNKPCANIAIGLDNDALNINKKVEELADEDKEKKCTESTTTPKAETKPTVDQTPKKPMKEVKTENAGKKKKNRNGKVGCKGKKVIWIIDSGCSRYMTGDMALLSQFEEKDGPLVTFRDNIKGFTMGYGKIISINVVIEDVALVAGLEVNLFCVSQFADKGFKASVEQSKLWHKKLSHLNFKVINTLVKKESVRDMPNLEFAQDEVHMGRIYDSKDETPHIIIEHIKKIEKQAKDQECVKRLRSDNGTEFRIATLTELCKDKDIVQDFSAARKPQQNGVVERNNRTLVEASRTML
ncbi:hypothetical protein AgCh_027487 [Apium graveolens]